MSGRRRQAVGVVSTQSEQAFEAMTILSKAKAVGLNGIRRMFSLTWC